MIRMFVYLLLCVLLCGCETKKTETKPVPVTAFQVEAQTIPADFQFVGVAKSSHPVEIRSRVEGYLLTIDYTEGDMVDGGQLLFCIDPSQFEASLDEAKGELARQEAILWRAKRSLERIEPLYEQNAASQRDRDNALAQVLAAEADVISAKANVVQAELNLSYTYITSPIRGQAGRARHREGALITPSTNGLLTLVSVIDPIWVDFSISDDELLQARAEGQSNRLILPDQDDYTVHLILSDGSRFPYPGFVNFASPTLDPQTGAMVIRAQFPNPEGVVLPGQFVSAVVSGAKWKDALFVPQESVFQGRGGMYVFIVDANQKVFRRLVQPGAWYKTYWIIEEGLEPGDVVVVQGTNKVRDGEEVAVTSMQTPSELKL